MKKIRFAVKIAVAVLMTAALSAAVFAAELTDIGGHWSQEFVEYGVENGYINGYPDSTFKPDNPVTRAEFAKMLNSALGITKKAQISFFDVEEDQWYYQEIQKAAYAGYVSGYENGSFLADNVITRQEAAVILSRIATRPEAAKTVDSFKDSDSIASWAKAAFEFAYSKGYFTGDDLGQLIPLSSLTRGQAAKILYMLKTEENVYNGDYTVTPGQAVCSETIFTDNVIFSSSADQPSITFDGCRVFGNVILNTKNEVKVTVEESELYVLGVSSAADITLGNGSAVDFVNLEAPAVLSGNGYGEVFLEGDMLSSGIIEINGNPENVTVSADVVIRAGELSSLQINKTSSVMIQSGKIENMKVLSDAAGSVITLASGVEVENLGVNAKTSFMGAGKIQNANNSASGVTYATKPEKLTGIGASDDSGDDNETNNGTVAEGSFVPASVSPSNGSDDISTSANFTLLFDSAVCDEDGDGVSASYVEDAIEIRKGTTTGSRVYFDATLTSSRRIVLEPEDVLAYDTRYYVIIKADYLFDSDGNETPRTVYSFTTEEKDEHSFTFTPVSGSENIDTDRSFSISFTSSVRRSDGTALTTNYLSNTAVELREGSLSGAKVDITATINSASRVITVNPDSALKPYTRYYLIIPAGTLEYTDDTYIARSYTYFTTADELNVDITPASGSTGVPADTEITLEFNSEIYRPSGSNVTTSYLAEQAIELRQSYTSGTEVDFTAVISSDRKTVTIIPSELASGTRYYITVLDGMIANKNGTEIERTSAYFTTASVMTPAITPANNSTEVLPSSEITVQFTDELYDGSDNRITAEYVEEKAITLRKNSSSGTVIGYEAQISSDYKTITLVPDTPLSANTTYYIYVTRNTLYNEDGRGNSAASSTFKTSYSNAPDFLPYNGEDDVAVDSNIEITFDRKMYAVGGAELTTYYVRNNVIELYKDSYDGEAVAFNVTLSTDKQTITINPTNNLEGDSTYVVVIRKASLEDSEENENAFYSSSFITTETVSTVYTVTPETKSRDVLITAPVVLTFESSVYRSNGSIASGAYIENNAIELRKGSTSGTEIPFTATVSEDNKIITITPKELLAASTTYYVRVLAGKLAYSDGTAVPTKITYFTTNDGKPVVSSFKLAEAGASYVTMEVISNIDSTAYVRVYDSDGNKFEAEDTEIKAGVAANITVKGLASDHSYTASVYVTDAAGNSSVAKAVSVTTTDPFDMEIGETGETSAAVIVSAFCEGTLDLGYKNVKTGEKVSRVSGLVLKAEAEREFTLSGLAANTNYEVYADFTDSYGETMSLTKKFTTLEPKEEVLEIISISLTDSNGDTYTSEVKDGKAEFTIEKATYINLVTESSVGNATVTYNEGTAVAPGTNSQSITVTPGERTEVAVVLTSKDTGNSVNCTVIISVNL